MLQNGADSNATDNSLKTPLHTCSESGNSFNFIEMNIKLTNLFQIEYNSSLGYEKLVQILIENGTTVDHVDQNGWTPLFYAAKNRMYREIYVKDSHFLETELISPTS